MIIKPAGASCNLNCDYCYYSEKAGLYIQDSRKSLAMDMDTLERAIETYMESQPGPEVHFVWHGGEPLLRPLDFYREAVRLQKRYSRGMLVYNSLQTNGTLLNEEWCRFLRDEGWLVGISIDGPERFHDEYRRDFGGNPSFSRVMNGIGLLERFGVEWNAMAVVNDYNAGNPLEFYNFFKSIGCRFLQFTPVTERLEGRHLASPDEENAVPADFSVSSGQWGNFLCRIFDEWVRKDVGKIFVQIFDSTLANWAGVPPSLCSMDRNCSRNGVLEFNGDVYCCDHYVFSGYRLGNIMETDLEQMVYGPRQEEFVRAKEDRLTLECRECRYLFACHGDCPRNRYARSIYGEPYHSCLCGGFRQYFGHVEPYMDFMKGELLAHRAPSNIMKIAENFSIFQENFRIQR